MAEIQHNAPENSVRVAAATALAPFSHPKLQNLPTPRYIERPVEIPPPASIEQATDSIARITSLMAKGDLDFQAGNDLIVAHKAFIDAKAGTELEQRVAALEGRAINGHDPDSPFAPEPSESPQPGDSS